MAATAVTIRADGLQSFQRGLRKASPALARAMTAELRAIGKTVRDDARALAPIGTLRGSEHAPGTLRRAIKHSARQGSATVFIDPKIAFYGAFIHEGFNPGGGSTHVAADPFLREAVDARRTWILAELEHILDRTLDRYL